MNIPKSPQFENLIEISKLKENGESTVTHGKHGYVKEEFKIDNIKLSKLYKKPIGRYSLLTFKEILSEDKETISYYKDNLIKTLKDYLPQIRENDTILVVGLGNRHISADSLGTEVVKNITVTRNIIDNVPNICAIAPSVMGLTGIETADTIGGIINNLGIDANTLNNENERIFVMEDQLVVTKKRNN